MKSAGTSLTDLMLNACFYFVNELYDCQVWLTIGNAMVQPFVRALGPKDLQDVFIKYLVVICDGVCFAY